MSLLKLNAIPLVIEIVFGSIPNYDSTSIRKELIMIPAASPDIDPNDICLRIEYFMDKSLFDFICIYSLDIELASSRSLDFLLLKASSLLL